MVPVSDSSHVLPLVVTLEGDFLASGHNFKLVATHSCSSLLLANSNVLLGGGLLRRGHLGVGHIVLDVDFFHPRRGSSEFIDSARLHIE